MRGKADTSLQEGRWSYSRTLARDTLAGDTKKSGVGFVETAFGACGADAALRRFGPTRRAKQIRGPAADVNQKIPNSTAADRSVRPTRATLLAAGSPARKGTLPRALHPRFRLGLLHA